MSSKNVVFKSGVWYTMSNFLAKGMIFLTTPIFTRLLTQEEFGAFSNFSSWLNILLIIVTLNIETTLISARYDFGKRLQEYVFSVLVLSTVSTVMWALVFNIFMDRVSGFIEIEALHINCMFLYLLLFPALNLYQVQERYMFRYKTSVLVSTLVSMGTLVLSVVFVKTMDNQLDGRIFGHVLPTAIVGLIIYIMLAIRGKKVVLSDWKYALKICLPYIPHLLSMMILSSTDRIMITKMCGEKDTALYSVAYNVGMVIAVLLTSLNGAYSPWLAAKLSEEKYEDIRKTSKIYIILFVCFFVGLILLAPEVLLIMGGAAYKEAKAVMIPVAVGCLCQFLYTLYVNVEQFYKRTVGMAFASVSAAVLNYVLNLWLIPKYGYVAAAYTTLIGYLWLLLIHMILVLIMKKNEIYSYKFVFLTVLFVGVVSVIVNYLYAVTLLRYIIIVLYGTGILYVLWKNRIKIISMVKR